MKRRVIFLLLFSIVLATAPAAMAQCFRCRPNRVCGPTTSGGFDYCYYLGPDCILGYFCGVTAATQPLASEYQVASVERADEPQTKPDETRITLLEPTPTPQPKPAPAQTAQR
jgi:hypothetical protein